MVKMRPEEVLGTHDQIAHWKTQGHKIVFTNGCFDIIHPGHIKYLQEAKSLGDKLVIGINSDSSVRKLKGEGRPIFNLIDRVKVLKSIQFVDLVTPFDTPTPLELIKKVKPDFLVKGGDYMLENIVGSKFVLSTGGIVKALKFVEGYSTTEIIDRIKKLN